MGRTFTGASGILFLSIACFSTLSRPAAAQRGSAYSILDVGTLGGDWSEAAALNNLGDVVGAATTGSGASHAFLRRNGQMFDLGTLPGGSTSYATAINDRGDIVGYGGINAYGPEFREIVQGFVWQSGAMRAVGALYCPCTFNIRYGASSAFAVSDTGLVVGESQTNRAAYKGAFLWQDGAMRGLDFGGPLPGDARAYAINDIHEIAGEALDRAFLLRDGASRDLGVLPGFSTSSARAVNNKGQVAGISTNAAGVRRGFLWDLGNMHDLGVLPGDASSEARAMNDFSDVVGRSGDTTFSQSRAVLWQGGVAIDLSTLAAAPGWTLAAATGINNMGQIAGVGTHDGQVRAFLLTPR
jgi:probable HAF family extracellular repeat protein